MCTSVIPSKINSHPPGYNLHTCTVCLCSLTAWSPMAEMASSEKSTRLAVNSLIRNTFVDETFLGLLKGWLSAAQEAIQHLLQVSFHAPLSLSPFLSVCVFICEQGWGKPGMWQDCPWSYPDFITAMSSDRITKQMKGKTKTKLCVLRHSHSNTPRES